MIGCFLVSREGGGRVGSGGCVGWEGVWELGAEEQEIAGRGRDKQPTVPR